MRTARTIGAIVAVVIVAAGATLIVVVLVAGVATGLLMAIGALVAAVATYRWVVRPWHSRCGSTHGEAEADLPGDELLLATAAQTTRAISTSAGAAAVWPWLVQLGWGRAGWYSYDWIDNDRHPSAVTLHPDLQHLAVGDRIAMTPDVGFTVRSIDPGASIVAQAPDGTTWCLHLRSQPDGSCRLVSRFRAPRPHGAEARLWSLLADPGAFVMERRMLRGIHERASGGPSRAPDRMPT